MIDCHRHTFSGWSARSAIITDVKTFDRLLAIGQRSQRWFMVKRLIGMFGKMIGALCLVAMPCVVSAEPLPDGMYRGKNDGDLLMKITGRQAAFQVSATRCVGEVSGSFADAGPGKWIFTAPDEGMGQCKISIDRQPNGSMKTEEDWSTCHYWHGTNCSFSGTVAR